MRKQFMIRTLSLILACLMLAGCGGAGVVEPTASPAPLEETADASHPMPSVQQNPVTRHEITEHSYTTYLGDVDSTLDEPFPLYFMDGVEDLPYVELESWVEMLLFLAHEMEGDTGYDLSILADGDHVILERENGYPLEIDFAHDLMVFDDYDAFLHHSRDSALLDMLGESGFDEDGKAVLFQRDTKSSFDRYGDMMVVNLSNYGIDLIAQDGRYYVPLQTMNDVLLSPFLLNSFLFNGEALFYAGDEQLFDYYEGSYTELAELYYDVPTGERSDALASFSYNELCMVLDTLYGLKEPHDIESFHQFFWQIGYDEALSGNSAQEADDALKSFIDYYLDDLHSVFNEYSWLSGLQPISDSTGMSNRKLEDHIQEYRDARAQFYPDGCPTYEEIGNTAYITFDSFISSHSGEEFYQDTENGEIPMDTIGLIIYSHSQIMRENSPVENVVIDLSNNLGGAVDAAVFVLGWILGDAPLSIKNMATGAMSTAVYRSDTNLDREFDEADTIADKNVFCLISPVSFSCGNSVPAALKASQKVTILGRTSGGGSCIVQPLSTAYGSVFQISSAYRISFMKNGSFYDIDQGVDPDCFIRTPAQFYDRQALTDYINSIY